MALLLLLWLMLLLLCLRLLCMLLLLRVVLLWRAVVVWRLVMAVVTVMAANMRLEIRERRALFATLTELTFRQLWNPCADRDGSQILPLI